VERLPNGVWLHLASAQAISAVEPDTEEARKKAKQMIFSLGSAAQMMLSEWSGGLDAATLATAIEEHKRGFPAPLN
jgi:hypothetical protein